MKNISFAASGTVPLIKTGGLVDVARSLPACFDRRYYDVRVVLPKHLRIPERYRNQMGYVIYFYMNFNDVDRYVGVLKLVEDSITFYFIDNGSYLGGLRPYGDWLYDFEKFAFFSRAMLSAPPLFNSRPDLVRCHDWQAGLISVYLKECLTGGESFRGTGFVVTIYNLKFQGVWDVKAIERIADSSEYFFTPDKLGFYKNGSSLKSGIVYADTVATVSPIYAEEARMPFYGEGLDGLMWTRRNSLRDIINGIDYREFNPTIDPKITEHYNVKSFRHEKRKNKTTFQGHLGLPVDDREFVLGIVSRLIDQKGFDLIQDVIEELRQEDLQFVILGMREEYYENLFRHYDWKYHGKSPVQICYPDDAAHVIHAGADAYLAPSPFEPRDLSQMMAPHYGTLPIARGTGGLRDTVKSYDGFINTGTGFCFVNYDAHEMLGYIRYARRVYSERRRNWNHVVGRAMQVDYSQQQSALKHQRPYDWLIGY